MKYKTAFRLALRAIGILIIAQNLPGLIGACGAYAASVMFTPSGNPPLIHDTYFVIYSPQLIANVLGTAVGAYLFFGGSWIINRVVPSNRPYCHECGYDMTGNSSGVCSECGAAAK